MHQGPVQTQYHQGVHHLVQPVQQAFKAGPLIHKHLDGTNTLV